MSDANLSAWRAEARRVLGISDRAQKVEAAEALAQSVKLGRVVDAPAAEHANLAMHPGYPEGLNLVSPAKVPARKLGSPAGIVALVHSLAHIEWNAINLALDAAARFADTPQQFAEDWIGVAAEEAKHFGMLRVRLQELDAEYGQLPAHAGLWDMAESTAASLPARMALVPRVLEARGLDVTPGLIKRLTAIGDTRTVAILEVILREEVGHVAIGSRWYLWACERDGLDPTQAFSTLVEKHMKGRIKGPFNLDARRRAGFSDSELAELGKSH